MIALGIDVSTKKLAIAGIRDTGSLTTHTIALNALAQGGRRLTGARTAAYSVLAGYATEACMVMVEEPWKGDLMRIAVVVTEAAQAAIPGAVVMTVVPPTWKKEVLGHGGATKPQILEHAKGIGYLGEDQDVADAMCVAQCGWGRWHRNIEEAA